MWWRPLPETPSVPSVIRTLPVGLSLRASWPMTTPSLFFAEKPSIVALSLTSVVQIFPSLSTVRPCG